MLFAEITAAKMAIEIVSRILAMPTKEKCENEHIISIYMVTASGVLSGVPQTAALSAPAGVPAVLLLVRNSAYQPGEWRATRGTCGVVRAGHEKAKINKL